MLHLGMPGRALSCKATVLCRAANIELDVKIEPRWIEQSCQTHSCSVSVVTSCTDV